MTPIRIIPADELRRTLDLSPSALSMRATAIGAVLHRGYTPADARKISKGGKRGAPRKPRKPTA